MKKTLIAAGVVSAALLFTSCLSTIQQIADEWMYPTTSNGTRTVPAYTNQEAITAMKDALTEGISFASNTLSKQDGYFKNAALKILLPAEAQPILNVLGKIPGGQTLADDVVLRLNRTAEAAAKESTAVFVRAITSMTVADGIKIVTGKKDAATQYLKDRCYDSLLSLYRPKVSAALNKPLVLNVSAATAWTSLVTKYNEYSAIPNSVAVLAGRTKPFPPVQVDLATYATEKALDGLFLKIAEEEGKIRQNPLAYSSAMIQKVFNYVKKGITKITV